MTTTGLGINQTGRGHHGRGGRHALVLATAASLLPAACPAWAQQAAREDGDDGSGQALELIVVTAQKREQSILDVPISMTAFDAEKLEKLRAQSVEDVLLVTPGVQYEETSDLLKTVSIRGINDSVGGLFQTTGVTIDDATLVATYNGFLLTNRLFDIERVEVLRGPQGALTGSHSTSGTINIITRKPELEAFSAEGLFDYGRFDSVLLRGVVNVPLSERLAVRAVAYLESSDGSLDNVGPAGGGSTQNHYGARIAARLRPVDRLTLDVAFSFEQQEFGASDALTINEPSYLDPANDGAEWAELYRRNINVLDALGGDFDDSDFINEVGLNGGVLFSDLREFTTHDIWSVAVRADLEMDRHDLTAIYTRYEHDVETLFDEDRSEFALISSSWGGGPSSDYAEFRVSSNYGGPINWVGGVSYMRERRIIDLSFDITEAFLPAYFGIGDLSAIDIDTVSYFTEFWSSTLEQIESTAIFANAFWDVTDRLHISAGGRVSLVETATQSQFDTTGAFGPFDDPVRADEIQFDPRVAVNYDLSEDVTVYVQFATGYRSGYGNTGPAVELGIAPAEVQGEKLRNYEIGLKGRFLDRRLFLSAAAFYMDYDNLQIERTVLVPPPSTLGEVDFDDNVNNAKSMGFEAEGSLTVVDGLILSASASYVKSTIDALEDGGVVFTDVRFPTVSPWTADASLDYTRPVADALDAAFRIGYSYRDSFSDTFPFVDFGPIARIPSYHTVDVSVGVRAPHWSVTAYMDNILNETYWQSSFLVYSTRGAVAPYNARQFGFRLTARL